jgi:alanyl-tRNA synthetase
MEMKAHEIRRKFLEFFVAKGHKVEASASLVPVDDPSLLWVNSGVAALKKYFDGRLTPENPRITNIQKSIRTNDIENVGYTARHHTFFEMLGNFSIGDYFKEEAIAWAWEFLTHPQWLGLEPARLSVTIHPEDEEAYREWKEKIGILEERIVKLVGNFWDIGEGPSGPNSEIFYDRGEMFGDLADPECYPGGENKRFLEIWNLVFSQYNHNPDGTYTPLPQKNIDTGMGLERIASVMQNVPTNYDTDLFQPVIQAACQMTGVAYGQEQQIDIALKVIADHIRTVVFAVADGVLPSNEGRGYVLRRLLRRAVRYGRQLGMKRPFLYELTGTVAEVMRDDYLEPTERKEFIERVIHGEEERFLETLSDGLRILEDVAAKAKEQQWSEISGKEAFRLYDTYGFPIDLTEDFARERGLVVDRSEFEQEMERQRERARMARQQVDSMKVQGKALTELEVNSQFVGYNQTQVQTRIAAILFENQRVDILGEGKRGFVILEETPFYAESGGQIADQGNIYTNDVHLRVEDVQKGPRAEHVHTIVVETGTIRQGDVVIAAIHDRLRAEIVKNHTATHLLHRALKEVLGLYVNQAGSLVAPDRLRFDFNHVGAMTEEEIREVERRVNEQIWVNTRVETMSKSLSEAKAMGAMALFGEKYGELVRVVRIGDYSLELCGGTHVQSTGEVGLFKILSESGIGSGIRRIEAITGKHAYTFLAEQVDLLHVAAQLLKSKPEETGSRILRLQEKVKKLAHENESLRAKSNSSTLSALSDQVREVAGIPLLTARVEAGDIDQLRGMMDDLRRKLPEGVIVLAAIVEDKVQFVASVSPQYVQKGLHAGKLVKEIATLCGGGGGGRPEMAQAGGKQPERLAIALAHVTEWLPTQFKF